MSPSTIDGVDCAAAPQALRELLAARAGATAEPTAVEVVETHMSWVFLAGDGVFKLKKPVRYPFLDFSTPSARAAACREEVRLNARLAPGIYRGLMALQRHAGALRVVPEGQADPAAETVDWLVWMRRLPRERTLDRLIARHAVAGSDIDAVAAVLAAFYRTASRIDIDPAEHQARFERERAATGEVLLRPQFRLAGAEAALARLDTALREGGGALRARAVDGRIVDGHGDLRPEHVFVLAPPVVIDALEFNPRLRRVDPFEELAFLALECDIAGAPWIGPRLIAACAAALGDAPPAALQRLYTADRALLRARLAMAHLLDPTPRTPQRWPPLAQRYIDCALAALA